MPLIAAFALATVFLVSAGGKLSPPSRRLDAGVALFEAVTALAMVSNFVLPLTTTVVLVMATVYLIDSILRRAQPCRCFGRRLPSTSRVGQRTRNSFIFALALLYFADSHDGPHLGSFFILEATVGIVIGLALIAGPWLAELYGGVHQTLQSHEGVGNG